MGYLRVASSTIGNFDRGVISGWGIIPADVLNTVSALTDTPPEDSQDHMCGVSYFPPLNKIIPLITFGSLESDSDAKPVSPSFVGIDCYRPDFSTSQPTLAVNLQTAVGMSGGADLPDITRPGCFYMSGKQIVSVPSPDSCNIVGDTPFHFLISFDIRGSYSANYPGGGDPFDLSAASVFTWALTDVSKVNESINPSGGGKWADNGLTDPKIIIPQGLIDYLGGVDGDTGGYSGMTISSSGNPMGIPASSGFVDNVYKIQMSDIQMFTDVTLDVTIEANRRAFITSGGRPASPALAAALLGKSPEIHFQTQSDWMTGNNRGTAGPFTKFGTVNPFASPF